MKTKKSHFTATGKDGLLEGEDILHYQEALYQSHLKKFNSTQMLLTSLTRLGDKETRTASLDLFNQYLKSVVTKDDNAPIVFLPLILMGSRWNPFAENHFTLLIINKNKKTIEYYDPKGGDLSAETRTLCDPFKMKGKEFLKHVTGQMHQNYSSIQYNFYKPQGFWAKLLEAIGLGSLGRLLSSHQGVFNRIDCGIFVCRAMQEYCNGGFEAVTQKLPKNFNMKKTRLKMQEDIDNLPHDSSSLLTPSEIKIRPLVYQGSQTVLPRLENGSPSKDPDEKSKYINR